MTSAANESFADRRGGRDHQQSRRSAREATCAISPSAIVKLVAMVAVALTLTSPTVDAHAAQPCHEDGDCKGMLLCRDRRCVQVHCRTDAQCPAGRMCHEELCRIRQCYRDDDCTIDRLCHSGICVIPQPRRLDLREPVVPGVIRATIGPFFPLGLMGQVDVPLGDNRWITIGLGTTVSDGGLSWRMSLRGAPLRWRAFLFDAWAGAMGFNISDVGAVAASTTESGPPKAEPLDALLGSGRWLFTRGRGVHAVWCGGGAGITVLHGPRRKRFLRIDLGLQLLFDDVYPQERDFAMLPSFGLQYGWKFGDISTH